MVLKTREEITRYPGTTRTVTTVIREWVCKECDYFEEIEDSNQPTSD